MFSMCLSGSSRGQNLTKSVHPWRCCPCLMLNTHYLNPTQPTTPTKTKTKTKPQECLCTLTPTPTKAIPQSRPTGRRQARHHRSMVVLLNPHPTEHHQGLILNSGNGSKPSMRMDRVLSRARSSSTRWLTGIGLVRPTPSHRPQTHIN